MNNRFFIWFNGTGESVDNTESILFTGLDKSMYTICPGWGADGFKGDNRTETGAAISGIDKSDIKVIRDKMLSIIKDIPANTEKLIVGGFSRGAAFFVPYFLKVLYENDKRSFDKLVIILHDPVNGSENSTDKTAQSLIKEGIYTASDKTQLMKNLKHRIKKIYSLFIPVGFDKRHTNFHLDSSFYQTYNSGIWEDTYITRLGISHSFLSSAIDARDKVIDSMTINGKSDISLVDYGFGFFKESLKNSKAYNILNNLFKNMLVKDNNDSIDCSDILYLQNLTTAIVNTAITIDYKKELFVYTGGNNETDLSVNNSRNLIIPQDVTVLENLIKNFRHN
ncbi:MAG: hypothetical protein N4A72_18760 [Bacteroidales bacterium]|jgi:hypothetical protein|nr:hypothetical protein [Bacteroidales bacterium]